MSKKIGTLLILVELMFVLSSCIVQVDLDDAELEKIKTSIDVKTSDETAKSEEDSVYELPNDPFTVAMNPKRDYLIIVDDEHPYEFDGAYDRLLQEDIVYVADVVTGDPTPIEKGALYAFTELQYALRQKGIQIGLYSAYRTKEDQEWVYENYSNLEGWSETNTVKEAGYSEHHTGLLLDIVVWLPDDHGKWGWTTETAEKSKDFAESKLLHDSLADYGFIDRYPAGKEEITGVSAEPYEIRFVGSSKIAHEIMDNNLCLEEYLENLASSK